MKRKIMKRICMLILSTVCMLSYSSLLYAADNVRTETAKDYVSQNAVGVANVRELDKEFVTHIEALDINLEGDSVIAIVPAADSPAEAYIDNEKRENDKYIYEITNVSGNTISQYYVAFFEEEADDYCMLSVYDEEQHMARGSETVSFAWPSGYPMVATGGITYNRILDDSYISYFNPLNCAAKISSVEAGKTCTSMTASFDTEGILYSYPEFEMAQKGYYWSIVINESNPQVGQWYACVNEMPLSAGVIHLSGGPTAGMFYTYNFTISDGTNQRAYVVTVIK